MTTKEYLESFLRLYDYGQCGKMLSSERKLFLKDKEENPEKWQHDNILTWCIKKALVELHNEHAN